MAIGQNWGTGMSQVSVLGTLLSSAPFRRGSSSS
jgi:hypothetical protein